MIEQIGIVGAGTMGNGIAQVCAAAGLPVVMTDISDAALDAGYVGRCPAASSGWSTSRR